MNCGKAKTMKTRLIVLAAGISLAVADAALSQSTVQFSASTYTVAESAGFVLLTVQRTGDTTTAVSVDFATADGTATNGLKYTATNGTLNFAPGETNQTIAVPILNNGFVDGFTTFELSLSNPTNAVLATPTTATVFITDNDVGLQFQFASYSAANFNPVAEDGGVALIRVVRGDDGTLPVTVDIATTDLTATNGTDYTGIITNQQLSFAPQEHFKAVSFPILNDSLKEVLNEAFRATLSNPVNATLGSTKTTTVTIVDNDQGFAFESATFSVAEDAGVALIRVLRGTDDTNATTTVDYATTDLTAIHGSDYTGITNTLAFAPGEMVKLVPVAILNDGIREAAKNFRLTLSNPTGGAVLGSRTIITVSIRDNDPGVGFELNRYTNAWENAGGFTVTVLRGNDGDLGAFTVDYATSDLTAKAGVDYQTNSGVLAFQENETVKSLTIPILPDGALESTESLRVTLSNPTDGATLGTAATTVDILDGTGKGNYVAVSPPFETALTIRQDWGVNILTWAGGGQLQRADRSTGPWQTLLTATNPYTVQSPVPTTFYRVTRPRPVNLYVPSTYDGQTPTPLVIALHGFSGTGSGLEGYMRFQPLAEARRFLYCYPEGTIDAWGNHFWNGTDGGGDFGNTGVDDAGYLRRLIEEIAGRLAVDRKRIHLFGHSNGGRMVYRMACESADLIAGIVSLAGLPSLDLSQCAPTEPVNILHIHGTADETAAYAGTAVTSPSFPANMPASAGALQAVRNWAGLNSASNPITEAAPSLDLTLDVAGSDTVVTRYTNSPPGGAVELWTIVNGLHSPTLSTNFSPRVIDWLLAHPKQ
jgi:polyhydroxybutyrate depolymerase